MPVNSPQTVPDKCAVHSHPLHLRISLLDRVTTYFLWTRGPRAECSVHVCAQTHWTPQGDVLMETKNNWERESWECCLLQEVKKNWGKSVPDQTACEHGRWLLLDEHKMRAMFLGKGQKGSKEGWCSLSTGGCLRGVVWAVSVATGLLADLSNISSRYWEIIWLMLMTELAPSMSYCLSLPTDVNKISSWYYSLLLPQLSLMRQSECSPLFRLPCQSTPGPG